jgi:inorganic pyrophosphatase
MILSKLSAGPNLPEVIYVVIEIPAYSAPVKYEVDKESGALFVDRILQTPMVYPCHYGFVPQTLGGDGDPIDVLVWSPYPLMPGCVIKARLIGALDMEDESGEDIKCIAVPDHKTDPNYDDIHELTDLPQGLMDKIRHFFEHYKDLEKNKWVKIRKTFDAAQAKAIIMQSLISEN